MTSPETATARREIHHRQDAAAPRGLHVPANLLGKLAPYHPHPAIVLLETLLLPAAALALGLLWAPQDPLQTQGAGFPWPWLAPVILALRYGPLPGLGAALVLLAGWLALNSGHYDQFPKMYFLGGLVLVMLVGEFASLWHTRTRRAETLQAYLDQRLEHLVRQHYLLRLSHDRLEQELIGRPMSMRDALLALRDAGQGSNPHAPDVLLRLLAQYCQLEAAALYPLADDKLGTAPLASLGGVSALDAADPLIVQALGCHKLCHVSQALASQQTSRYLVAAPLRDLASSLYGLLVVEDMPFFALQEENLQTLNLLLGYYTDGLSMHALAAPIVAQFPDCPPTFAFELQRLGHIHRQTQVPSIVVVLECLERAIALDLPQQIQRLKREMDEIWCLEAPQRTTLAVLMPLGDAATAEGYIARLQGWAAQQGHASLADAGVFPHVIALSSSAPETTVARIHGIAHA